MNTIRENVTEQQSIQHSEFIGMLIRVTSEQEVKDHLTGIRKAHPQATHICYAYILNQQMVQRYSDDGEPARTAGIPILELMKKHTFDNMLAVVIRYYGGVKLGTGGLIRAYSGTISLCINKAQILSLQTVNYYQLSVPYHLNSLVAHLIIQHNITVLETTYHLSVDYQILGNQEVFFNKLSEISSGQIVPILIGQTTVEV
jgi:uncharacterized YigZ family protein